MKQIVKITMMSLLLQRFSLRRCTEENFDSLTWTEEDGFSYAPVTDLTKMLDPELVMHAGNRFISSLEFEWIKVTSEIRPHYHRDSDAVTMCVGPSLRHKGYFCINGIGMWKNLVDRQVILAPALVPHGFRRDENHKRWNTKDLFLLSVSSPGIKDTDVVYMK